MQASLNIPAPAPQRNWNMIARVGVISALVLAMVGYALKVTYESVVQGGVVNKGQYFEVELKQMSNFEMDQINGTLADVPARFRDLDGKKVLLTGEVAPTGDEGGPKVSRFSLCYSVAKCCFGGPQKVQHFVECKALPGKKMPNYLNAGTINVYGTLHVKVIKNEAGGINHIFQLDVERIERA